MGPRSLLLNPTLAEPELPLAPVLAEAENVTCCEIVKTTSKRLPPTAPATSQESLGSNVPEAANVPTSDDMEIVLFWVAVPEALAIPFDDVHVAVLLLLNVPRTSLVSSEPSEHVKPSAALF